MRNHWRIFLLGTFLFLSSALTWAKENEKSRRLAYSMGDSIMEEVIRFTGLHRGTVISFDGEAYVKGTTSIGKSNFLMKWFPHAFPFDHTPEGTVFEVLNEIHYSQPNRFSILPVAINSTNRNPIRYQRDVSPLLAINLYTENSVDNKYILPGTRDAKGIYEYRLDSLIQNGDEELYRIRFLPRRKSLKLLSGYLYVRKGTPLVTKLEAEGRLDIAQFDIELVYGSGEKSFMLPEQSRMTISYNILNNVSVNNYYCDFKYTEIKVDTVLNRKRKRELDLTKYFSIRDARVPFIADTSFWNDRRMFELTREEKELYRKKRENDSLRTAILENDTLNSLNYLKMSEKLVSSISFKTKDAHWKYSGFINPAMLGYSKNSGFSFRQRIRYRKWFPNSQYLSIMPEIGFASKRKELFYRFYTEWLYKPDKVGCINFSFRNGNRGFSSSFIDEVNHYLDSTQFNFDDLNIRYYRDYHLELENSYEITNGLMAYIGISYNYRKPLKPKYEPDNIPIPETIIKQSYADFVPYARLSWTPFQYYKMDGKQKIYVDSRFPTMSVEFSRAIAGVMGSTSKFEKVEFDICQTILFNKLRSLSYRAGIGSFFNQQSEYFVNFRYFQRSNYPDSWDDIGGAFNLLDNNWYYASPSYIQLHLMYDSPFILLHAFKRISRYVLSERIYASQLYTPAKPCYTELGYGMGNYIFNVAFFTGFHKGKLQETGFRVTFELGKYW